MPRRIGKDTPRGRHRRPARQVSTATAWPAAHGSRPASVRRSAACDSQHFRLSHRAQYRSDAFTRWSSACARFGRKQTFWNASDAPSQSLATVGAREPPICSPGCAWCHSPGLAPIGLFCYADRVVRPSTLPVWRSRCWRLPGQGLVGAAPGWAVMKGVHSAARADGSGQQPPLVLTLPCPGGPPRRGPAAGPGLGLRDLRPRDEGLRALAGRARRGPGGLAAPGRVPGPSTPDMMA